MTFLICNNCGSTKGFRRIAGYSEYATEVCLYKDKDHIVDRVEYETNDSEFQEWESDYICDGCSVEGNVKECSDEKRLLAVKLLHTDQKGKWYKEPLPESKQNTRLRKLLVTISI